MSVIMPEGELLRRAAVWICEERESRPERPLSFFMDEAGMRFNLGPAEQRMLAELFAKTPPFCGDSSIGGRD